MSFRSWANGALFVFALIGSAERSVAQTTTLKEDINLVDDGFSMRSQRDFRWNWVRIGPHEDVRMYQCGCFLTDLSSAMEYLAGAQGSLPWYSVPVIDPYGLQHEYFDFSPIYLHLYFRDGNQSTDRHAANSSWGYLRKPPNTCGVALQAGATERAANPALMTFQGQTLFASPTGLTLKWHKTVGLTAALKDIINRRLTDVPNGKPTFVGIKVPGGNHLQIIAGWDSASKQYLIFDPFMLFPVFPKAPGGGDPARYAQWEKSIIAVGEVDRAFHSGTNILGQVRSPLELLAVAPNGQRTGFDPAKAASVEENPGASYYELGGWTDPTGEIPPGEPVKLLEIDDPPEGTYRFQATGTGPGPFELDFSTSSSDDVQVFQGVTSLGEVRKYEMKFSASGAMTMAEVQDFSPQANISGERSSSAGAMIAFDGSGSFDVDGSIASYSWNFGDGATATGSHVTHAYAHGGVYATTLTVVDRQGATGTASSNMSIVGPIGPQQGPTELITISTAGQPQKSDNTFDLSSSISADGRVVAFESRAFNLVPNDTNGVADVFVRDRQTGTTERINISSAGSQDDSQVDAGGFSISADGRFVAFASAGSNLVTGASDRFHIYVRDRLAGTTELVSVAGSGEPANGSSFRPSISSDGRFVAFVSLATDLVSDDTNAVADIFVRDRLKGTTERVSVSSTGQQANPVFGNIVSANCNTCTSDFPQISGDGRYVSFVSLASNLVPNDTNQTEDVFVHDRLTHTTERVSVSSSGNQQENLFNVPHSSALGRISADGHFVVFTSAASNLVPGDSSHMLHIFIHDRVSGSTERVDVSSSGQLADGGTFSTPSISSDGRFVAFFSRSGNLVNGFSSDDMDRWRSFGDVFVRDRLTGSTELLDISQFHSFGNGPLLQALGSEPSISADGRFVSYTSSTDPIVLNFFTTDIQVYLRDRRAGRPVANASGPYLGWASSAEVPAFITFDASKSVDPSGGALTARWDFGDGSSPVNADVGSAVQHAYASPGNYTVKLTVSNGTAQAATTTSAEVLRALASPKLSLASCAAGGDRVKVELGSFPLVSPAGGWNFGGTPSSASGPRLPDPGAVFTSQQTRLSFSGPTGGTEDLPVLLSTLSRGEFYNQLEWDVPQSLPTGHYTLLAEGLTSSLDIPCPEPENHVPVADAGGPYSGGVGAAVRFDGSHSSDADSDSLTFDWDFGDGTTGTGVNPQHSYAAEGTFLATLIVNDGKISSTPSVDPAFSTHSFAKVTIAANGGPSDTTPPTTAATLSPLPNAAGWNNNNVTLILTASDNPGGSGVKQIAYSTSGAQALGSTTLTGSTANITISAEGVTTILLFATDQAGNVEATQTLVVRVDKTPPVITGARGPLPNANGWNNTDVTVSFNCSDSLSGLAAGSPPADAVLSNEGAGQSVTSSCQDLAGNSSSATVGNISIDKTPPMITGSRTPQANSFGWNNSDVTVTFACADAISGVSSCGPATQIVSTQRPNQSRTGTATDLAGNMASAVVAGINIDKTAPTLTCVASPSVLWPPDHRLVNVNSTVNVSDGLSGAQEFSLQSANSNEPDNGLGDGDTANDIQGWDIGTPDVSGWLRAERSGYGSGRVYTFTYRGTDKAGNAASCSTTVMVPHDQR